MMQVGIVESEDGLSWSSPGGARELNPARTKPLRSHALCVNRLPAGEEYTCDTMLYD